MYASETENDQHRGTENKIEGTATVGESLDSVIRDDLITSAEDEHANFPVKVDVAECHGTPEIHSDNLETTDGERKGCKAD